VATHVAGTDAIGSFVAALPFLMLRWLANDETLDHNVPECQGLAPEDLEVKLRSAFGSYCHALWQGQLASALEGVAETAPALVKARPGIGEA
jgi:hypothetical protein